MPDLGKFINIGLDHTLIINSEGISENQNASHLLDFLLKIERLKNIPRTGWALRGVQRADVETVAEHSNLVGLIALIIGSIMNRNNCHIKMGEIARLALLHDLPEVILGDLDRGLNDYFGKKFSNLKVNAERQIMRTLIQSLDVEIQQELEKFWFNYYIESEEKQIVVLADKIEAGLQALIYIRKGYLKEEY